MKSSIVKFFLILILTACLCSCNNNVSPKIIIQNVVTPVNNPPAVPGNPAPPDRDSTASNNLNLSWHCSDPDQGDSLKYDVYLSLNNPPANTVVSNYPLTTFSFGIVNPNVTLYWKVVARDSRGALTSGPVWEFTTAP
jgi:hypothetical protein